MCTASPSLHRLEQRRLARGDAEHGLAPGVGVDHDARPGTVRGDAAPFSVRAEMKVMGLSFPAPPWWGGVRGGGTPDAL